MKQNAKALYGRFEKSVWGVAETPLPLWKERAQRGLRTVFISVSYTHLDVYKRQVHIVFQ